jgi:hypothetical protein
MIISGHYALTANNVAANDQISCSIYTWLDSMIKSKNNYEQFCREKKNICQTCCVREYFSTCNILYVFS